MSAAQTTIYQRIAWTTRERHLAQLLEAVERTGHLREPEYAQGSLSWPRLRTWKASAVLYRCAPLEPIAAYLQTRGPECRYLLVSLDGYVLAEGDWCSTQGGARGWLGRSTVKLGAKS
jgi:hypothetical protein